MSFAAFATLYVLLAFLPSNELAVRFTNIKCVTLHPDFATFPICGLKVVKRATVAMNLHVKLWQVPVNNVSVNLSLYKKASGYRPFLYNVSGDFCEFLRNRKRQPFGNIIFNIFRNNSNINHTCPYDVGQHDIIISNLTLREDMLRFIPAPAGEYMVKFKVGAYNDWKAVVEVYVNIDQSIGLEKSIM